MVYQGEIWYTEKCAFFKGKKVLFYKDRGKTKKASPIKEKLIILNTLASIDYSHYCAFVIFYFFVCFIISKAKESNSL